MCSSLYFINTEGAKPFKYGRGQHLITSLSLPRNEIQHCSNLARHYSCANKRVCCRNYVADTTMVSHLNSFHQLSHMADASINAKDKIVPLSPSLTLWRSVKAFMMPKHPGHILQGFNNIFTTRKKTPCKRRSASCPWFFLSILWQNSFMSTSLHNLPYSTRSSMTKALHLWTKHSRDASTLPSYILSFHAFLSAKQWADERYILKCSSKMVFNHGRNWSST